MPKLSKFTKGKVKIPIIKKSVPKILLLLAVAGAGAWLILGKKPTPSEVRRVPIAPKVNATLTPNVVRPNTFMNISGTFVDEAGKPVRTSNAKYYVFERNVLEGMKLVSSGTIGNDIDRFQKSVPTTGWNVGQYLMVITDEPLSQADVGGLNAGPPPFGIGAGAIPPGGSTTVPTAGQGITLG